MRIEAETAADYWDRLPDDWRRERMARVRAMIAEAAPGAAEGMGHGMLRYAWSEDRIFCHMNAQKGFVGLYLGDLEALDPGGAIRGGTDCGKSCVRIRKTTDMEIVRRLIEARAVRPGAAGDGC